MLQQCLSRAAAATLANSSSQATPFLAQALSLLRPYASQPDPSDWTQHTNVQFSIRPSVLSPLFATHQKNVGAWAASDQLKLQLQAQDLLQGVVDVREEDLLKLYSYRIQQYDRLMEGLKQLESRAPAPTCASQEEAVAYFKLLSEKAQEGDEQYKKFWQLVTGASSVWDHWSSEFASKYAHTPVLEPMEVIYNKRDRESSDLRQLRMLALKQAGKDFEVAKQGSKAKKQAIQTCGKRKASVANIVLQPGIGNMFVNGKPLDDYFRDFYLRAHVLKPLFVTGLLGRFNFKASVSGGGISGQAQAVRHAVSKAMHQFDPQLGPVLGKSDLLERDSRVVERKKPGRKKARKSFTWVKR